MLSGHNSHMEGSGLLNCTQLEQSALSIRLHQGASLPWSQDSHLNIYTADCISQSSGSLHIPVEEMKTIT